MFLVLHTIVLVARVPEWTATVAALEHLARQCCSLDDSLEIFRGILQLDVAGYRLDPRAVGS